MVSLTGIAGPALLVGGAVLLLGPEARPVRRLLRRVAPRVRAVDAELDRVDGAGSAVRWRALPETRTAVAELAAAGAPQPDAPAGVDSGRLLVDGSPVETPTGDPLTVADVRDRAARRSRRRLYGVGVAAIGLGIFLQWWGYVATA